MSRPSRSNSTSCAGSFNGQRLVATTAIRNAGSAVLVNYHLLGPPYDVACRPRRGGSAVIVVLALLLGAALGLLLQRQLLAGVLPYLPWG